MPFHGRWIRDTLYGSPPRQFLASAAVLVGLVFLCWFVQRLRPLLREKIATPIVRSAEMVVLAVSIIVTAYLLAEIWAVSYVVNQALEALAIDRWNGIRATLTIAILLATYLLIRAINRSIDRIHTQEAITTHQREVAYHVADIGIFVAAILIVLSVWGVNLTNLILSAGVATAVLGLAARKTVAAIIAGFMLLLTRPFRAGDWIEIAGGGEDRIGGHVQDITLSHTKIRTFNDEHALVPNDELTTNLLINYSRNDRLRIDLEIGVDYETDLDHARTVIKETVEEIDVASSVRPPYVVIKRFDDSAILLELQFWIERPERRQAWTARTDAITAIKAAFDREGITIPFPQRTHGPRSESGFRVESSIVRDRSDDEPQADTNQPARSE